jgi:D-alanyl-D-alanine carboxypeptidase/D-alanyl-D-alanine-endopeptidase (penicillin-binding protein 4)
MKTLQLLVFFLIVHTSFSQPVKERLAAAMKTLEADSQMRHAIIGLCVVDTKTGMPIYEHNAQVGLAAASTQKLFTSGAAFELLGQTYRYKTELGYDGTMRGDTLKGNLYLLGSGDPTLGSWRWKATNADSTIAKMVAAINKQKIKTIDGNIISHNKKFSAQGIPDGWIWQDIGNYYGAGAYDLNWKENQYNLALSSGTAIGGKVDFRAIDGDVSSFINELTSAKKGSGDNAFIYLLGDRWHPLLKGTIPVDEKDFKIAGAIPYPPDVAAGALYDGLFNQVRFIKKSAWTSYPPNVAFDFDEIKNPQPLLVLQSPTLDSINYWFLKRSINLYGEALVKTIALEKAGIGSTEKGVELVKDFWNQQGIDKSAINIIDGSGLSPQNRVTADAEVKVLQYAKTRPWFASFYYALPEYNGMKMKSGSIGGARAFAGYHTAKDGKEYTYSIIVNNYDGSSGQIVRKLYKVLDELK